LRNRFLKKNPVDFAGDHKRIVGIYEVKRVGKMRVLPCLRELEQISGLFAVSARKLLRIHTKDAL
jgi:hypothetical protein